MTAPQHLDGGCHCGRVRYRVGSIFDAGYCHCSVCRRVHGAPVVAWIAVPEADFGLLDGAPRAYRSSSHGTRHRCDDCGTHLYYTDDRIPSGIGTRLVSVYLTTLDAPERVQPRVHQWCDDRLPWFDTRDHLPRADDGTLTHPDRRDVATDGDLERELRRLEDSHLRAEVRASPEAIRSLLADDFVEFGSSGRVLDRAAVEASLVGQPAFASRIDDFVARALSSDAALTTYRLSAWPVSGGPARVTLRSSVWMRRGDGWVMVFHQGTATDEASTGRSG
jgi:hypothetical protein